MIPSSSSSPLSRLSPAGDLWGLGAILAIAAVVLVPLVAVVVRPDVTVSIRGDDDDVAATDAASPREQVGTVSVTSSANAYLGPAASYAVVSGHCIAATTTPVYAVEEGATGTSDGDGPYCTDPVACVAGAVIPLGGRIWARTASGTSTLRCRWRDDGAGAAALVPGGGVSGGDPACELTGGADCTMSGAIRLNTTGTASDAPLQFAGDPNTGFRRPLFDTVALVAGGFDIFTVSSSAATLTVPLTITGSQITGNNLSGTAVTNINLLRGIGTHTLLQPYISNGLDTSTGWTPRLTLGGAVSNLAQTFSVGGMGALQLGGGSGSTTQWVIGANDSVNVAVLHLPRSVSTTPAAPSSLFCDVSRVGMMTYYDDTNDAVRGRVCVCTSTGGSPETYAWRDVSDMTTACP